MEITSNGHKHERHIAVFTFPFASHPPLLLTLVRRLASACPSVVFSFFSTEKSNRALFSNLSCDNILPYNVTDGIPDDYVFVGKPQEGINFFLEVAKEELKKGVKMAEEDIGLKVCCLVVDIFLWFSADIADEMNVPWVAIQTAAAGSLSAHFYTDHIRQKSAELKGSVGPDDEMEELIPGLPVVRLGDLPGGVVLGDLKSPFSTLLHEMGRNLARAAAVGINSFQELEPDVTEDLSSKLKRVLNVGPLNLISTQKSSSIHDEYSCIPWLEDKSPRSVAYIAFGTVCNLPTQELVALAEALEDTKISFMLSIKNDSKFPKVLLERISTNGMGKIIPWAPQVQVLEHSAIGAFVTHCGWKSVVESIGAGVPMICRPFFGDQQMNTWMVEKVWGIGVRVEGGSLTKHGMIHAFEQVLSLDGSSKSRLMERLEALKDLAHKAVGPDGSSSQNFKTLVDVVMGAIV